jgi:hypothetical protein
VIIRPHSRRCRVRLSASRALRPAP